MLAPVHFKKRNVFDINWTMTKLLPFVVLLSLFLGGCMGINQLQPAPLGSHVEDAPSPSGKHLNKEKDPSAVDQAPREFFVRSVSQRVVASVSYRPILVSRKLPLLSLSVKSLQPGEMSLFCALAEWFIDLFQPLNVGSTSPVLVEQSAFFAFIWKLLS